MKPARALLFAIALGIAACGFVGYKAWRFYRHAVNEVDRKVEQVAALFRGVFGESPRLVVNHRAVWGQSAPIAEFAVVEREGDFSEEWKQTRFLSTKRVVIRARYLVKAGFDLRGDFAVDVDPRTGDIAVFLPPAKILSVEPKSDFDVHAENGLVNWLTDADIAEALKYFRARVTEEAERSGLPAEAEREALARLDALAKRAGLAARFIVVPTKGG